MDEINNQYKSQAYVGVQGIALSPEELVSYTTENGHEKTAGYLQGMHDFQLQMAEILGGGFAYDGLPASPHIIRKKLIALYHHNKNILKQFEDRLTESASQTNSPPLS